MNRKKIYYSYFNHFLRRKKIRIIAEIRVKL
jgi:hypothetical protein